MKEIAFSYEKSALISPDELRGLAGKLERETDNMKKATLMHYTDDRASINLPNDARMVSKVKDTVKKKCALDPAFLIVIGIGGSNLGTIAVQETVLGRSYNQLTTGTKILYADTVDSDSINDIIKTIELTLRNGGAVIINGVSKSGGTTETIANFEILTSLLRRYKKQYQKYIVVTTDKDSKFWNLAIENGFDVLEIPKKVGGRYSVFSPVGLFPLGMIEVNIDKLLQGASWMKDKCLSEKTENNPAAISAALLYLHHKEGKNISDLFLFSNDLEPMGKWYRQLMGESIGKEFDKYGKKVFSGITPTVSIGSTDLHSMAQLYLGGPYDKFTTFLRIERNNSSIRTPNLEKYSALVDGIQEKSLPEMMDAILEGIKIAFKKAKRPFAEITLPDKSEYSIGQLLQFKMMEIMYLGFLLDVNPFDQPNVEMYKIETGKILARGEM
ncbi:Glucose-6-phosphate isomerase [subsurface metagenome]|jgi:glucose-6-phosphate isomerase